MFAAYQIVASVSWSLELSFPEPYQSFNNLIAAVTQLSVGQIFPMGCFGSYNHHAHLLVITLVPLLLYVLLGSVAFVKKSAKNDTAAKCLQGAVMVSFLILPTTSTALFRTFHCMDFEEMNPPKRYLFADLSIDCDSDQHKSFQVCEWYRGLLVA